MKHGQIYRPFITYTKQSATSKTSLALVHHEQDLHDERSDGKGKLADAYRLPAAKDGGYR